MGVVLSGVISYVVVETLEGMGNQLVVVLHECKCKSR